MEVIGENVAIKMINAIKEQQSQIDTLTKAMNALIKKVEKLEE